MPNSQNHTEDAAYTVTLRGHDVEVKCVTIEQVVEAVRALAPLEREVAVPRTNERAENTPPPTAATPENPVAQAVYGLFRAEPRWRRPIEIVKALRKRGLPRGEAAYNRVYAVLRYGDFVQRDGRWNTTDGA